MLASVKRAVNSALLPFDLKIVRASRVHERYDAVDDAPPPSVPLPPDAAAELLPSNPRLCTLQQVYAGMADHPARSHSLWNDTFAARIDLPRFRANNAYLWQGLQTPAERMQWLLTAYYVASIDDLGLLNRLAEDGRSGAGTFKFMQRHTGSKDLLDSINEMNFLQRAMGLADQPALRVLDIGAGYGRLMHRLVEAFPTRVTGYCVDAIPQSTFLSEFYLRHRGVADRVEVVSLDHIADRFEHVEVDLVTNVHSFSECCLQTIRWWLDLVARVRARYLFVVPNAYHNGGTQLLSREADNRFLDFRPDIEARGFRLVRCDAKYLNDSLHQFGINTYQYLFAAGH